MAPRWRSCEDGRLTAEPVNLSRTLSGLVSGEAFAKVVLGYEHAAFRLEQRDEMTRPPWRAIATTATWPGSSCWIR